LALRYAAVNIVKALAASVAALAGVAGVIVAIYALGTANDSNAIAHRAEASANAAVEAATPSEAKFTSPTDLQTQECTHVVGRKGLHVEGSATKRHEESLWLLIRGETNPVFYVATDQEISVNTEHIWGQDTGDIGSSNDARAKFTLMVVAADYNGANQLQHARQTGDGSIPILPPTVKPIATACVVRK
jgi:hypothetical protein